jgi:type 2 lantibiotic biosynthesis protein LanM
MMSLACFDDLAWYRALTLTERIVSLRAAPQETPNGVIPTDLARRRLQRWQSQSPFTTSSFFAQRLAMDGISEEGFLTLLGEPMAALCGRFPDPPAWLAKLAQAFLDWAPDHIDTIPYPEPLGGRQSAGFLVPIEPLVKQGRERVREGVQALVQTRANLPFNPSTVEEILFANLPRQLAAMLSRTMVLELHVARLQGLLQGATPEERFHSFLQRMSQQDITLALFREYPVLVRQLMICINRWAKSSLELLQHLCADWDAIRTAFCPQADPGILVQISISRGDTHRGGRAVAILQFSSGFQVVYKPRSLSVEVHFQKLLTWLNARGVKPAFPTLKVVDRRSYGWVEFVFAQPCTSQEEVQRFYQRLGGYLALMYALEATDLHYENLIAAGESPVLIDLESLCQPRLKRFDQQPGTLADDPIAKSVLRVGLLPQRVRTSNDSEVFDISGLLGVTESQLTPYAVGVLEGQGMDEMRFVRRRLPMDRGQNRPTLNGHEIDPLNYTEAFIKGFTRLYGLLLKHRDDLLSDGGPLAHFLNDEVRVVLRASQTYIRLIQESFHPDVLHDALDRDRFFDHLWAEVPRRPYLAKVISAEHQDLLNGDIPIFTTRPGSRDLWTSSGERIADFFTESSMAVVQQRVQQLSDADLAEQCWFIRASLARLATDPDRESSSPPLITKPQTAPEPERLLGTARAVGDRLAALAEHGEEGVSWIGLTSQRDERHYSVGPLGTDLYDGLPGVALFLGYLGAMTREACYTALGQATVTELRHQVKQTRSELTAVGGFVGWGGVIYTLTHLGVLWDQPALLADAEAAVGLLPALVEQDEQFDLVFGAAGCIGSLISLYHWAPSYRTLAVAIQCGDRLLAHAQQTEHGLGWITPAAGKRPLAGFSHGAAGIAWALLELTALTGKERFRTAALAAIADERSLFFPEAGNWRDLRPDRIGGQTEKEAQNANSVAWCHGAPGIGLARLQSLPHLDDPTIRAEIDIALKITLAKGFGKNHSLCHGDLGNLELLLHASQMLDSRWRDPVDRLGATILESIRRDGCLCGVPSAVEVPGLMNGLAGIGYGLLRLAEPTRIPSVLVLAPPIR